MLEEYDFHDATSNPYQKKLRKAVTLRLDTSTIDYFKGLAQETGIPYQNLINLYLGQCAKEKKRLSFV